MGVTRPAVHITADPALLLQPGTDGAVDSFLLSQKLDPAAAMRSLCCGRGMSSRRRSSASSRPRSMCMKNTA